MKTLNLPEQARFAADRAEELEKLKHAHEMEKMHTEFRMSEKARKTHPKITGTLIQITLEQGSSKHQRCHTLMRTKTSWTAT